MSADKFKDLELDDSPDVYESENTGPFTEHYHDDDVNSASDLDGEEGVVKTNISNVSHTKKLFNKQLSIERTDTADFSGSLSNKRQHGYFTNREEFSINNEKENETILEKLARLVLEVQDLEVLIQKQQKDTSDEEGIVVGKTGGVNAKPKVAKYSYLVNQVSSLQSDLSRIGKSIGHEENDPQDDGSLNKQVELGKKLLSHLKAYKSESKGSSDNTPTPTTTSSTSKELATYELFYTPESAKQLSLSKFTNLESRVAALEKIIGSHYLQNTVDSSSDSVSTIIQNAGSLINALNTMDSQIQFLINPKNMDTCSKKLASLIADHENLLELRKKHADGVNSFGRASMTSMMSTSLSAGESPEIDNKINKLFDVMENLDGVVEVIPHLLARLFALQKIHGEAVEFADSLKQIEVGNGKLMGLVKGVRGDISALEVSVKSNQETIENNVGSINARIVDLVNRLDKLKK